MDGWCRPSEGVGWGRVGRGAAQGFRMAGDSRGVAPRQIKSADPGEPQAAPDARPRDDLAQLLTTYLAKPFLELNDEDAQALAAEARPPALGGLIAARHAAMSPSHPAYAIFCMPKSGSSFVQSALRHALQLPFVSLTTAGSAAMSSRFGMNAREQELDEFAIVKAKLTSPEGFVAQHHTRFTPYLGRQLKAYGITPILTVRNIFDCLVSFDDMMLDWRADHAPRDGWIIDPYVLPADYPQRDPTDRYHLLANALGLWAVQFVVSWKRGVRRALVAPVIINYDRDVLDPHRFVSGLGDKLEMTTAQRERLQAYAAQPDPKESRLNVGQAGRGREQVSQATRTIVGDYARTFADELSQQELDHLLG